MEKYGFVYLWFDRKHKRYYVGCHWGHIDDGYVCSSNWMRDAYTRRPKDFKRRVLKSDIVSREATYIEEQRWLKMIKPNEIRIRYYNLNIRNNEVWHKYDANVKTVIEKISTKTKEAMQRPEVRAAMLEGMKTRICRSSEPEVREKMRKSNIGKNTGKDNSKALAMAHAARRGVPLTEEHRAKIKATTIFKTLNSQKHQCKHCGASMNIGNISRYHNDKCKMAS